MDPEKPRVVACLPAYDEERNIAGVVLKAQKYVDKVIVCDDGSTDMTGEIASRLGAEVLRYERNVGKGVALRTAFRRAKEIGANIVVTLDADGQHDPEQIPTVIGPIARKEADVVIGSRYLDGSWADPPLHRRLGLTLINSISARVSNGVAKDTQSGFRAYSSIVLDVLMECESQGYGIETEQLAMLAKKSFRVLEVPITVNYKGLERTSKKNPLRHGAELVGTTLRLVVEERPLLLLGIPGMVLVLLGVSTGVLLLFHFNSARYFSIPLALMTLGAFFMGTILLITSLLLYAIARLKNRKLPG